MLINISFYNKMYFEFYIFLLFSVFQSTSSAEILPGFGDYKGAIKFERDDWKSLGINEYNFTFQQRLPHWIGDKLLDHQPMIRTFPTEINDFKENTEYTKNISLEMESSCGSSKSRFDETDVVTLTLMEKRNNISVPIKTIKVDPLSVDFYSHKLTRKQFDILAKYITEKRTEYCEEWCKEYRGYSFDEEHRLVCPNGCMTCPERIEEQNFAEMEKYVKIMNYLRLFQYRSPSCTIYLVNRYVPQGVVEIDNKTASSFPKLNNNHYFLASFIDTKSQKSAAIKLKDYKII